MRPSNKSRSRNKPGNSSHGNAGGGGNNNPRRSMGNIINRVFESAGPDGKVRGTPQQIIDKYQALARDAQVAGDRVAAENYLQHSEHYSRLLGEAQREQGEQRFNSNQNREETQRDEAQDFQRDMSRQPQPQPQQQPQQQPQPRPALASGLAMIEPEDSEDFGGPIETPEGGARRVETPVAPPAFEPERSAPPAYDAPTYEAPTYEAPAAEAASVEESAPATEAPAAEAAAPEAEAPAAPVKRPRPRRKAKVEPEAAAESTAEASQPAE